ncbi:hypothetical protein JQ554_11890 [Bradyrhizobium diazoefficiens]|nr:hypothetical protein [Bradyrhizobium diazoefficiens]MBR0964453.1 hypothetical protein [Bradyrhizobium diazoefficiens]MBR0978613.1 hypothetical protein [Bradyrhizobium diazoefficiens]MBR1008163.1 hypothetical protein [Bradyrhizobium diazoefficiens]MBR1013905.1 hypothetical protein [Bradyrhizobium diazoefficiens]MBR1051045.1 hypothetical protein [Bradyrhizobium diazoefficiens]
MKQIAKASKGGQGLTQRQFTDAALQIAAIGHRALEARKMPVVLRTGNAKPDTFSRLAALAVMQATYRTVRPAAAIARRIVGNGSKIRIDHDPDTQKNGLEPCNRTGLGLV